MQYEMEWGITKALRINSILGVFDLVMQKLRLQYLVCNYNSIESFRTAFKWGFSKASIMIKIRVEMRHMQSESRHRYSTCTSIYLFYKIEK